MTTVVQQIHVPEAILSLSSLAPPDYVDLFTVAAPDAAGRSPDEWARAAVEAAGPGGQFVWRVLCGLRLERRGAPQHIGGWRISGRAGDWIRLEASSWFMTAQLVLRVEDGSLSVATCIRYDAPAAAAIWTPLSAGHRFLMPGLLRGTVRSMRRTAERAA